jgi:hypothetical protein
MAFGHLKFCEIYKKLKATALLLVKNLKLNFKSPLESLRLTKKKLENCPPVPVCIGWLPVED